MVAYGKGGLRSLGFGALHKLARLYWYTVEFGLIEEGWPLRTYGAGIVSSRTESLFSLDDSSPNRLGFDVDRALRTHDRIDDFQETCFVIDGLDALLNLAQIDFAPLYQRALGLPVLAPGELLAALAV
jgi:phenylalanine-4-hydroxylase